MERESFFAMLRVLKSGVSDSAVALIAVVVRFPRGLFVEREKWQLVPSLFYR